ncbi:MAG: hypothetical protein AB7V50_10865, partial [Vampirovibrionia bacterium]
GLNYLTSVIVVLGLVMIITNIRNIYFVFIVLSFLSLNLFGGVLTGYFTVKRMMVFTPSMAILSAITILYITIAIANIIKNESIRAFIFDKLMLLIAIFIVLTGVYKFNLDYLVPNYIAKNSSEVLPNIVNRLAENNIDVYALNFEDKEVLSTIADCGPVYRTDLHIDKQRLFINTRNNKLNVIEIKESTPILKEKTSKDIVFIVNDQYSFYFINILLKLYPYGNLYSLSSNENSGKLLYYLYFVKKELINEKINEIKK